MGLLFSHGLMTDFIYLFALGIAAPNHGPLRNILVTLQSHRVYHSKSREHCYMNFVVTLSIWDQLFGTQYRGWDEYPSTGVGNSRFPREETFRCSIRAVIQQFIYPFRPFRQSLAQYGARMDSRF